MGLRVVIWLYLGVPKRGEYSLGSFVERLVVNAITILRLIVTAGALRLARGGRTRGAAQSGTGSPLTATL